jgi:quinol monooxygenase YgiN
MSVNVILDLHVSPENREELLSFLTATLADTRAYKGYVSSVMTSNEDDIHNIVLLEQWQQRIDHENYITWRTERGDASKLLNLLSSPPVTRYLTTIPT